MHKIQKIYTFLFSILLILLLNSIFFFLWIDKFPYDVDENYNLIIKNLSFSFGPLLDNFINQNEYYFNFGHDGLSIKYYLGRMPFIPIFIKFIYKFISENFLIILLFKNIFFFLIIFFYFLKKIKNFFFFFFFFFFFILFIIV